MQYIHNICNNIVDFSRIFCEGTYSHKCFNVEYCIKAAKHSDSYWSQLELQVVKDWIIINQPERILDIGCNNGMILSKMCKFCNSDGVGIDINRHAILEAKNIHQLGYESSLRFDIGPAERLPLPISPKFDFVLLHHVIGHLQNVTSAIEEINRVLKPGGFVSVIMTNIVYKLLQFPANLFNCYKPDMTCLRYLTIMSLDKEFAKHNIYRVDTVNVGPFPTLFKFRNSRLRLVMLYEKN